MTISAEKESYSCLGSGEGTFIGRVRCWHCCVCILASWVVGFLVAVGVPRLQQPCTLAACEAESHRPSQTDSCAYLHQPGFENTTRRRTDPEVTPIIYVHFQNTKLLGWAQDKTGIDTSFYLMHTLMASTWHGNPVWLVVRQGCELHPEITQRLEEAGGGVFHLDGSGWPRVWKEGGPLLRRFRAAYRPWGQREPWERENMERYFAVLEVMTSLNLRKIFYADSDVAVLVSVRKALAHLTLERRHESLKRAEHAATYTDDRCDAWLVFDDDQDKLGKSNAFAWANWWGTALVSRDVLADFLRFAVALYESDEAVNTILDIKRRKVPYVCDMTLAYLYRVAASAQLRADMATWGEAVGMTRARRTLLTAIRRNASWGHTGAALQDVRFCNIASLPERHTAWNLFSYVGKRMKVGFDVTHGHLRPGFRFETMTKRACVNGVPLFSIHFQGDEKSRAPDLLAMFDAEGNPLRKAARPVN